ncbi:MAG: metal-dependent hydrolase [Gemmatimonadetes bacterium]|nr:metal-dependent hydrolase [Gemmatimonadota bacterium]
MDNITHALAGLLLADATTTWTSRRTGTPVTLRFRRTAVVLGIVAAEFPDSDLVYAGDRLRMGPLGYLLHHRGHTHTLVFATLSAALLWWIAQWWWTRGEGPTARASGDTPRRALGVLALVGTWSHLLLDWTNSYGVHPFWPLDNRWYYGDAVFIIEPWLWVAAIPPLWFGARSRGGRVVLATLLVAILVVGAAFGAIARGPLVLLGAVALLWTVAQWWMHRARGREVPGAGTRRWGPVRSGVAAWTAVTLLFAGASRAAQAEVQARVADGRGEATDVVLTPAPGDPTCWSALVVSRGDGTYRVSSALVAPVAGQPVAACAARYGGAGTVARLADDPLAPLAQATTAVPYPASSQVAWRRSWAQPGGALATLAAAHCDAAEALRFMRVPVWQRAASDASVRDTLQADARYGIGAGAGFAELRLADAAAPCTLEGKWIPPWVPPRSAELQR